MKSSKRKIIYAVGIGPGNLNMITPEAKNIIEKCEIIAGYSNYIKQIMPLISENKEIIQSGMRGEIDRCTQALDKVLEGKSVAVISSGDAGIYAMGGLIAELIEYHQKYSEIEVLSVAGVTASSAAAAVLGAPLMNDFAVLSLSDLLTPRELILKRIAGIASSGLVCCLYNPGSIKRRDLLEYCIGKFREIQGDNIYVGIVWNATKENQATFVCKIKDFPFDKINMNTMVIIGNEFTVYKNGKLFTTRGYCEKYYDKNN
ncbi:precorrin-3B C(17)-methyltransferase [Lentisphaerota bacterium WC36G]|nr:precorrin-3B C(17)-methyltransferase [Lentisphaerae bacterium WC36]